jgi:3-phenylpropionate/trans-cinnamate dioxygenase ferredoxin subunit
MTGGFTPLLRESEFPESGKLTAVVAGWPVLVCRLDGAYRAVLNRCSHAASSLGEGRVRRGAIACPLHGAMFDLTTGQCVGGAYPPLMTFEVRVAQEWIEVRAPDAPPSQEHMPAPSIG